MSEQEGVGATVESGDITVTTNYGTAEEAQAQLELEVPDPVADAAAPAPADGRDPQTGQFAKPGKHQAARHKPNDRINLAVGAQREAERRADAAERRLAELEARQQAQAPPAAPARPQARPEARPAPSGDPDDPEPDPDNLQRYPDGQFDRKYLKEQSRWEARQELRTVHRYQQEAAATQRQRQALETRAGEVAQALQAAGPSFLNDRVDPRLADAVPLSLIPHVPPDRRPQRVTIANWAAEQVFRSDRPAELAAHLSDPQEIQRLATLLREHGEQAALRAIARIEAGLGAAPAAAARPVVPSQARKPIQPLGSSPQMADPYEVSDDLDVDEHIRRMNAKDRAEGRL
jgi:hypothetical protein